MIARAAAVLLLGTMAACAPAQPEEPVAIIPVPIDLDCGFNASKDYRRTQAERDNPPACGLPEAQTLAQSCAIYDVVRSPGYVPDEEDETGEVRNPTPLPAYRVNDLVCAFNGEERNRATCRFALTVPGGAPERITVRLRHISYGRITPLTFEQGVMWQIDDDCTPTLPEKS